VPTVVQPRNLAICRFLALRAGVLWFGLAGAAAATSAPECWRELTFAAGNSWASASTTLRFETQPRNHAAAQLLEVAGHEGLEAQRETVRLLHIDFEAMRSRGTLEIWYDPSSGAALQSRRIGQGADSRMKVHRFLEQGVWRVRRAADGAARPEEAERWELRSEELLPYPRSADSGSAQAVIVPELLLAQLATLGSSARTRQASYLVFSDKLLYRVNATAAQTKLIAANVSYEVGRESRTLHGPRPARRVRLAAQAVEGQAEDGEFTLFELGGDLSVFIDVETALPLGIQGTWMGVGTIPVSLARARIAADCGG
jgi:hypothetical protein